MADLHDFPYTEYESGGCQNLGCMMRMCHKVGVKLAFNNGVLELLDRANHVISTVQIAYAESAATDLNGNPIIAYLISAGIRDKFLVLRNGNGQETILTIPYAETAKYTEDGDEINSFIKGFAIDGDQVRITLGNGTSLAYTIPFATKAATDINNKSLTSYAAGIAVSGNDIILTDGQGRTINQITVHFAETAAADEAGNNIRDNYASKLQAGTTTLKLFSKSNELLSEITCPFSTTSHQDEDGNLFLHDYAEKIQINLDGKKLDLLAHDGTLLSSTLVPFSTLSTDATNAIERAEIIGNQLVLTTYGNQITRLEIPWALKAGADKLNNQIDESYVADVRQDATTGVISFYAMDGSVLAELTPNSRVAEYDTFDNLIGDFIKTLVFDNQSKYLIATHGTGTADSIRIEYATAAWKDDIGNIIKNVYHKTLLIEEDNEGRFCLIGLNGEGSEITRLILPELTAAVGSGLVINQHNISLTNEVKERIYDFDYVTADERLDISTHVLTT